MSRSVKEILFDEEARNKLRVGIDTLADAVCMTLGPKGRNVTMQAWTVPTVTNDGSSIVKEIELRDEGENIGVSLGKEVAAKIKEKCGDGTTTGILLFRALVQGALKNISSGTSPIELKRGFEKALIEVLKKIDTLAQPIKNEKETLHIATISASGDAEIGEMVSQCFTKIGKEGVVTIEEAKGLDSSIELVEGMALDRGYLSAYFCTDLEKMLVELKNPFILVTDRKISSIQEILPLLQQIASSGMELLIIADDVEGEGLSTLVINKLRGTLKIAAIKAPGFGERRKELLQDIAIITGATFITEEAGLSLKDIPLDYLGKAEKAIITREKTTLIKGKGSSQPIQERMAQLDQEIAKATSSYDKEKLEERKAKLKGLVAIIHVGAQTEPELKQKKQVVEDSLNSTRAALEEGTVPGGGIALLRAAASLEVEKLSLTKEEQVGARILIQACQAPCKQIIENTLGSPNPLILEEILQSTPKMGFNALTEKVEDLTKAGVLDAAKVVKSSLIHAVSVASVAILSEALMYPAQEEPCGSCKCASSSRR